MLLSLINCATQISALQQLAYTHLEIVDYTVTGHGHTTLIRTGIWKLWTLSFLVLVLNEAMLSCDVTILTVDHMTWAFILNMTGQTLLLYRRATIIWATDFYKLATIAVPKITCYIIHFSLPLISFTLIGTEHINAFNKALVLLVWKSFHTTTHVADIGNGGILCTHKTRLAKRVTAADAEVRFLTGAVTDLTHQHVWWSFHELIVISAQVVWGCGLEEDFDHRSDHSDFRALPRKFACSENIVF